VVSAAYEASGCRVIGTATSGQAARTLGREADLGESRTLASLLWRLDHNLLVLDERSVVVLDEVCMTEDAHLVALTARIEAAGAKLVLVGDHHQLGPVGPGGALAALARRHPDVVHQLTENRRQHDPAEHRTLAQLRDGSVAKSVARYSRQGRLHTAADRDGALQEAVDAWAADVEAGHHTGLYAWRRANVAALNQRARQWMDATGRLCGPQLVCPGGNTYRAGDQVVTLAPGSDGRLVTSQRALIAAIDPSRETLTLRTDDGQHVHLGIEEAGSDRLGYGYATTVHRCQGSTTERAHLFADGGGRELAYVAMSRARQSTHVWTVADDLAQAVDDLNRDWSTQRTPTWALDTPLKDHATLTRARLQALGPQWPPAPLPRQTRRQRPYRRPWPKHPALVVCDRLAEQLVVAGQRRAHGRLVGLPQASGPLNIGEQDRDDARRASHHPAASHPSSPRRSQTPHRLRPDRPDRPEGRDKSHPPMPRRTCPGARSRAKPTRRTPTDNPQAVSADQKVRRSTGHHTRGQNIRPERSATKARCSVLASRRRTDGLKRPGDN
jgi:hypothetical protein